MIDLGTGVVPEEALYEVHARIPWTTMEITQRLMDNRRRYRRRQQDHQYQQLLTYPLKTSSRPPLQTWLPRSSTFEASAAFHRT